MTCSLSPENGQLQPGSLTVKPIRETVRLDAGRLPFRDKSFDLVIGSPPYLEARTYGRLRADRGLADWVDWMLAVTKESLRVTRGCVVWVCAGTGGLGYQPGPEGLVFLAKLAGFKVCRPCYWESNKAPSGRRWFSNTIEYVLAFGEPHYFNVSEIATQLKYRSGGSFRQRGKDGNRKPGSSYPAHTVRKTAPNSFRVPVGGGMLGHPLAHESVAPYPIGVPSRFIRVLAPPGGAILDPFGGSGSTWQAAIEAGRTCVTGDLDIEQCHLSRRRIQSILRE